MDHRIDSSADAVGSADPRRAVTGTPAPATLGTTSPITKSIEPEPGGSDEAIALVTGAGDNSEWVSPILRAGAFAIIAFQIGYTVLDSGEFPQNFARTLPLHIASMTFGLIAVITTLSPRLMRNWRAISLAIYSSIMASMAWIAVINGNSDVLVASIVLFFFVGLLDANRRSEFAPCDRVDAAAERGAVVPTECGP